MTRRADRLKFTMKALERLPVPDERVAYHYDAVCLPKIWFELKSLILSSAVVNVSTSCLLHSFPRQSASDLGFELAQHYSLRSWLSATS